MLYYIDWYLIAGGYNGTEVFSWVFQTLKLLCFFVDASVLFLFVRLVNIFIGVKLKRSV